MKNYDVVTYEDVFVNTFGFHPRNNLCDLVQCNSKCDDCELHKISQSHRIWHKAYKKPEFRYDKTESNIDNPIGPTSLCKNCGYGNCDSLFDFEKDFKFCPQCGAKIIRKQEDSIYGRINRIATEANSFRGHNTGKEM